MIYLTTNKWLDIVIIQRLITIITVGLGLHLPYKMEYEGQWSGLYE